MLGRMLHYLGERTLPAGDLAWVQVRRGPAKGIWLELNPRTGSDYLNGRVEIEVQTALASRLKPGCVFYDLGANIGFFSLLAAKIIGERGKIVAFEPDRIIAQRLRRNVARNDRANITIRESGVWSVTGSISFVPADTSSPDRGTGRFVESGPSKGAVPCVSLDDFCQSAEAPAGIKCDVEGAELEFLRGARVLLSTKHPWIICETHSETNAHAARSSLRELGYRLEQLNANHFLAIV